MHLKIKNISVEGAIVILTLEDKHNQQYVLELYSDGLIKLALQLATNKTEIKL